jgi:hypothetical protein
MDMILSVERHDYRELARVTLTDQAAAELRAWKKSTWLEVRGHATGETARATGATAELLSAICSRVEEYEQEHGWEERHYGGRRGLYHAVIVGEGGQLVHATAIERAGDGYRLAG